MPDSVTSCCQSWVRRSAANAAPRPSAQPSTHTPCSASRNQLALPEVTGLSNVCQARSVDTLYEPAWQRYQYHYLRINGEFSAVYPGVVEGLAILKSMRLPMACLTNKPTAFAVPLLRSKGLDPFFDCVFGGDAFERKKPDPLPLRKTCEALGTEPARTLMVGDSSNDAQAARAAGCPVVLVTYGYNHGQPVRDVDADGWVEALHELVPATA